MDASFQSMTDMAAMQATSPAMPTKSRSIADIDKTAKNFESMFVSQMLQPMFETVDVDPVFGGGNAEGIMRSFLVQEYGKITAQSGRLGIAAVVKNEMIKSQAIADQPQNKRGSYAGIQ